MTPLEIARRELAEGVREATGRNDGVPAERYNDGELKPWCAAFVRFCFEAAGAPLPGKRWLLPSVDYLEAQLLGAGARLPSPTPGAIVTFARRVGSDAGPGRHVGIVEEVGPTLITTIEGNVGNAVARRKHARTSVEIAGYFGWPKGGSSNA